MSRIRIHVDQEVIRKNMVSGDRNPPLSMSFDDGGEDIKASSIEIGGHVKFVYSPDKSLASGATVWVELIDGDIWIDGEYQDDL